MKKLTSLVAVLVLAASLASCATHVHKIGNGGSGKTTVEARQWYILMGLIPLNDINSAEMAGSSKDYTITTQATFMDIVIGAFTGIVTINCRTVKIDK